MQKQSELSEDSLYNIEQWVHELMIINNPEQQQPLTPRTKFLNLSLEEGTAIYHSFQKVVLPQQQEKDMMFNSNDEKIMKNLEEKIGELLKKWENFNDHGGKRVFCRLSTRSPKDACLIEGSYSNGKIKEIIRLEWIENFYSKRGKSMEVNQSFVYSDEIEDFEKYVRNEIKYNEECLIFMRACQQSLSVSNEIEVLDILTHSERVLRDLQTALEFPSIYDMKLIFREWNPEITYEYEFRGFIHDFELMALTQYDKSFKFNELIENKNEIGQSILNFYNTIVKPVLRTKSNDPNSAISKWNGRVVMDFAILQPSKKIIIVECNPFNDGTGAALFEADRSLIVENYLKTNQLDFRIVTDELYTEMTRFGTQMWECLFSSTREQILEQVKQQAQQQAFSLCNII